MSALAGRSRALLNRRELIVAATGLGLGVAAAGGLAAADAFVAQPTLTIIGEGGAQFSLVRVEHAKIGLLFGAPSNVLLAAIGPMLGWTSPWLDVLAVAPASLTATATAWLGRQGIVRTILVPGPVLPGQMANLPARVQARVLATPVTIALEKGVRLDLLPAFSTAAVSGAADAAPPLALVRFRDQTIAVAGEVPAFFQQSWVGGAAVFVVPIGDLRQLVATRRPAAVAINGDKLDVELVVPRDAVLPIGRLAVVPTYPDEHAVLGFARSGIHLPWWSRVIEPGQPG